MKKRDFIKMLLQVIAFVLMMCGLLQNITFLNVGN